MSNGTTQEASLTGGWNIAGCVNSTLASAEADFAAKQLLMKRITNARREMIGGEFVNDLRRTIRMVVSPGRALSKGIERFVYGLMKDRRFNRALRRRRTLGESLPQSRREAEIIVRDKYLEAVFGWLPLVDDIQSAARAVAKTVGRFPPRVSFSSKAGREGLSETARTTLAFADGVGLVRVNEQIRSNVLVIYRGQVHADVPGRIPSLAGSLGFWPRDFLPTIWECIPFSFVADYFSNVQELIAAYSFVTSDLAWTNRTIVNEGVVTNAFTYSLGALPAGGISRTVSLDPGYLRTTSKTVDRRSVIFNSSGGRLELQLPGVQQFINVAAVGSVFRQHVSKILFNRRH